MRIEDHTNGCVAHMAVLAGKLWFLGKSRSNPLCMGEWVGCGCCIVRLNVNCQKMGVSCWNRLYDGTVFRLVFFQPCRV